MPSLRVQIHPAEPPDLLAAWEAYQEDTPPGDRDGAHRPAPGAPDLPPPLYMHLLATSGGAFWMARAGDAVAGFAAAVARGRLWLISELWVAPAHRGRGVGGALLRMLRRTGRGVKGRITAAVTGDEPSAVVLGLRAGLEPRGSVFVVEGDAGASERLRRSHRGRGGVRVARYDPGAPVGPRSPLARLDRELREIVRPEDHRFWLTAAGRSGSLLWRGKRAVAYWYLDADGNVGPLAATGTEGLLEALGRSSRQAARARGRARFRVPGACRAGLEALLAAGFQLVDRRELMASGELGRLDRYLPGDDSLL